MIRDKESSALRDLTYDPEVKLQQQTGRASKQKLKSTGLVRVNRPDANRATISSSKLSLVSKDYNHLQHRKSSRCDNMHGQQKNLQSIMMQ